MNRPEGNRVLVGKYKGMDIQLIKAYGFVVYSEKDESTGIPKRVIKSVSVHVTKEDAIECAKIAIDKLKS